MRAGGACGRVGVWACGRMGVWANGRTRGWASLPCSSRRPRRAPLRRGSRFARPWLSRPIFQLKPASAIAIIPP
ncbi:MAG: hypothetical protein FJ279_30485 [Planctomycetes bacterium]|nr:hypothetical protein [Planctomycetota bacterium]